METVKEKYVRISMNPNVSTGMHMLCLEELKTSLMLPIFSPIGVVPKSNRIV